jgi:aminoglycoside phosphotransferase (APT) family kinase protein
MAPVKPADELADPGPLIEALRRMKLVSIHTLATLTPLAGGVSSDIYRVQLPDGVICIKRALSKLKVAADWQVPVERNHNEVAWLRTVAAIVPDAVPAILGEDGEAGAFAMAWLPPERYPVWKAELAAGRASVAQAAAVGATLGRIHAATADQPELAARFRTDALFHAIRLDPYLHASARAHPDLAGRLHELAATTAATRRVLVHGDFSPKNILLGPHGPVFLDAECAWYGDPAFDLAFVLNHLLLKGVWQPQWRRDYAGMYGALVSAYRAHVHWEPWHALDARAAALLGGLLLARVDGKSPVEYVTDDAARNAIRAFARTHLRAPLQGDDHLQQLVHAWTS